MQEVSVQTLWRFREHDSLSSANKLGLGNQGQRPDPNALCAFHSVQVASGFGFT